MSGREFNVIVFGASGFTGKYVVEEIVKLEQRPKDEGDYDKFTWAVSGRSVAKLDEILDEASHFTGVKDLKSKVTKIVANVNDSASLREMAKRADVVINCVGPYRFYGEQVVKACIDEGTSHVDVSGEPQFLEGMQLKYHEEAKAKGVYIVGACGWDSIPADCGVTYLMKKFQGELNSAEVFLSFGHNAAGSKIHFGTWQSAIHGLAHARELRPLRRQLFPEPLPKPKHKLANRGVLHFSEYVNGWCLPFPGSDKSVIQRSQRHFYKEDKKRPIQVSPYFKQSSWIVGIITILGALIFGIMTQFKCTRWLLENYPRLFSFGKITHEGPSREEMNVDFSHTIVGKGWAEKLSAPTDQHSEPPSKTMIVKVKGNNPGYGATCICLIFSALAILYEKEKMPANGGVYPPGAAFYNTSITDKLNKNGLTFEVIKE